MKLLFRFFRHLLTTTATGRRIFPAPTLEAIQKEIASGEKRHRAEIRLIVEPALPLSSVLQQMSSRERARELFSLYRLWDTEENLGILLYINLADHKVEIIGDRAANRALSPEDWQAACRTMTEGFRHNAFHESTVAALTRLNETLALHFPAGSDNPNEISNRPVII